MKFFKILTLLLCICLFNTTSVHAQLTQDLKIGDKNQEVILLQKILNLIDIPVAQKGPGSKGNETTIFGIQTEIALKKFQCERGIACEGTASTTGFGMVDSQTRRILNVFTNLVNSQTNISNKAVLIDSGFNKILSISNSDVEEILPPQNVSYGLSSNEISNNKNNDLVKDKDLVIDKVESNFTKNLFIKSKDPEVKLLQIYLNTGGFIISTTGPGSPGNETTYFGPATQRALIKFQIANNITPAVGYFGPVTRARLR